MNVCKLLNLVKTCVLLSLVFSSCYIVRDWLVVWKRWSWCDWRVISSSGDNTFLRHPRGHWMPRVVGWFLSQLVTLGEQKYPLYCAYMSTCEMPPMTTSELVTVDEEIGHVTIISWVPNGQHIAIGSNSSDIQLWDYGLGCSLRTLLWGASIKSWVIFLER